MRLYYKHGGVSIFHGDCRDWLASPAGFDVVITDPPYGVMLGEVDNGQRRERDRRSYGQISDTQDYLEHAVIPALKQFLSISLRGLVFCGCRNIWKYPPADDIGAFVVPAGAGIGRWGFICAHPILYYGADPKRGRDISPSSYIARKPVTERNGHPCPKPLPLMKWAINKASLPNEIIVDPFCGSGTTLLAAKELGRRAIGIEIEERYCEIAARRLAQEILDFTATGNGTTGNGPSELPEMFE